MWLLFAILLFVLLIILIWQQIQHKELEREINYITDRLASLSITSDNGFVLIPTDNDSIKKLPYFKIFIVKNQSLSRANRQWRRF